MQFRQTIPTRFGGLIERPPRGAVFQMTEYLRRYALFATARTIGIHPGSLPFGLSSGIGGSNAARSGCRGIGLSEAFSTVQP